ncbi:MAG TPA: ROK family protein [Anaerolineales bacterium]|nr:ROK family protein [Anaerolineales bacterium]
MNNDQLYGGIEAGGTKFVCVVGSGPGNIVDQIRIETTIPDETFPRVIQFFKPYATSQEIQAIGIGCFGPLDLNPDSPTYGFIASTPKLRWRGADVLGTIQRTLNVRATIDTDVNAAALGEFRWGASRGCDPSLYLTIGTGIGGGCIKEGRPLRGLDHPEMGHIRIPHDQERDPFSGACPFHGDCFEGLASGPAIEKRSGKRGESLREDDPYWDIEAEYIASALCNYILILSPRRIILGGGIMERTFLFPRVREKVLKSLNGYVENETLLRNMDRYIVPPALGNRSGSLGAIALAQSLS